MSLFSHHLSTLAAASPPEAILADGLGSAIVLMIVGMGVVFGVLVLVGITIALMSRAIRSAEHAAEAKRAREEQAQAAERAATDTADDGLSPELVAVLTAAAVAAIQRPARLRRVVFLGQNVGRDWVAGGRATIMGSHRPHLRRP